MRSNRNRLDSKTKNDRNQNCDCCIHNYYHRKIGVNFKVKLEIRMNAELKQFEHVLKEFKTKSNHFIH